MIELLLPTGESARLLWSQTALLWLVALYAFPRGPYGRDELTRMTEGRRTGFRRSVAVRAALTALVVFGLAGLQLDRAVARGVLALAAASTIAVLPLVRLRLTRREDWGWAIPSLELAGVTAAILLFGVVIAEGELTIRRPLLDLPFTNRGLRSATVVGAGLVFLTGGATHFVRGILDAVRAKPRRDDDEIDVPEYNRGRVIGNLERVLLLVFALTGAYQAMALVVGAKGLVRWTDLKNREFAEYFLIGSLASLLLAICVALAVNALR